MKTVVYRYSKHIRIQTIPLSLFQLFPDFQKKGFFSSSNFSSHEVGGEKKEAEGSGRVE